MSSVSKARAPEIAPGRPGPPAPPETQILRHEGDYWTIVYAGVTIRVRDTIGMHYLGYLLTHPHQRVPVNELLAAVKGTATDDVQRARSAVSKRVRAAIEHIARHHAGLGYHLRAAVKTGVSCVYPCDPERPLNWVT
ncbi:MAG TPA: hypothetical protein VN812_19770 [Candidatus Acidoferrales bacterium]|nr:hypothetical protein [Candidatus Acidoferrales bacterium]